jgi:uncharacterized protein YyaL (SSP411 family)
MPDGLGLASTYAREDAMAVDWKKQADAALTEAKKTRKPILLDFSAAPM